MNKQLTRRALGRGLAALIPQDSEEQGSGNEVVNIDIGALRPNPFQPRTDFNEEEIAELAASIQAQGLMQPVVVRKKLDGYEIISGERRTRALKKLGWDHVPCLVRPKVADREMLELALVENLQRRDLNEIETARGYQRLLLECSLSHEDLSKKVGKSRSAITNALRMLKLPEEIQRMVMAGTLSMGHARALLAVEDAARQREIADKCIENKLSVREIEELVGSLPGVKKPKSPKAPVSGGQQASLDPDLAAQLDQLNYRFGTAVRIKTASSGRGRIEIQYENTDDFSRILGILLK